ncbi:hypothetical protein IAG25_34890 [Caballeronia sp. EK]|nr:hypothetical protein [Caballeronia sp. EK]MBC8642013.1 hypothetical protein [Caballeronia sp. EK]
MPHDDREFASSGNDRDLLTASITHAQVEGAFGDVTMLSPRRTWLINR